MVQPYRVGLHCGHTSDSGLPLLLAGIATGAAVVFVIGLCAVVVHTYQVDPKSELIASTHTVDEIKTYLRVESLAYLSLPGLLEAAGEGDKYCEACFTGNYPISFSEMAGKDVFDKHAAGAEIPVKPLNADPAAESGED